MGPCPAGGGHNGIAQTAIVLPLAGDSGISVIDTDSRKSLGGPDQPTWTPRTTMFSRDGWMLYVATIEGHIA